MHSLLALLLKVKVIRQFFKYINFKLVSPSNVVMWTVEVVNWSQPTSLHAYSFLVDIAWFRFCFLGNYLESLKVEIFGRNHALKLWLRCHFNLSCSKSVIDYCPVFLFVAIYALLKLNQSISLCCIKKIS